MAAPQTTRQTVKTTILIISDTHAVNLTNSPDRPETIIFSPPFPKADVVLHCGDLTNSGRLPEFVKTIDTLAEVDAELKLVIAGNHDLCLDDEYVRRWGYRWAGGLSGTRREEKEEAKVAEANACKAILVSDQTRRKGIRFLDEGLHKFTLRNGSELKVYASPYTPEFCGWAFAYEHNEDRWNPADKVSPPAIPIAKAPIPEFPDVDIVMTHGPPAGHLDIVRGGVHVGCEHLKKALRRSRPQVHCFGHIHESWGAERVEWYGEGNKNVRADQIPISSNGESLRKSEVDFAQCQQEKSASVDLSSSGPDPLPFGRETLVVNASIMNMNHRPLNPPWLINIDLPVPTS